MSPRQAEIVELVAAGLGDKEIATRLGISTHTVRTHLQRVYREQEVRNRAEAAAWATATGQEGEAREAPAPATRVSPRWAIAAAVALLFAGVVGGRVLSQPAERVAHTVVPSQAPAPSPIASTAPASRPAAVGSAPATAIPAAPTAAPTPAKAAVATPRIDPASAARAELDRINSARTAAGLPPVAWDPCLADVAEQDAARVAAGGTLLTTASTLAAAACAPGSTPVHVAAYWPSPDDAAVTGVLLGDPVHHAELLGPYREMGAAWVRGGGTWYLVIDLA